MDRGSEWSVATSNIISTAVPSTSDSNEEAELSSDEDYSPGSLVIDTGAASTSPSSSSNTTPVGTVAPKPLLLPPPSQPPQDHTLTPAPTPSFVSSRPKREKTKKALQSPEGHATVRVGSFVAEGTPLNEDFQGMTYVMSKTVGEGNPPVDTFHLFTYRWSSAAIDVLFKSDGPIIPIKNIYEKVIPGLKRNVLSARISKLGIRSIIFVEPHLSTVKKLGLFVTGSSHYVTIPDFVRVSKYFKLVPPPNITRLCDFTSSDDVSSILAAFGLEPSSSEALAVAGKHPITNTAAPSNNWHSSVRAPDQLNSRVGSRNQPDLRTVESNSSPHRPTAATTDEDPAPSDNVLGPVDLRRLTLSNGDTVTLLVREGSGAFFTHIELPKILPTNNRSVIESVRSSYKISVNYTSKAEVGVLKHVGVVGMKAGRCVLYKATDVAKMFSYWNQPTPLCITEVCEGKLPSDRITVQFPLSPSSSHYVSSPSQVTEQNPNKILHQPNQFRTPHSSHPHTHPAMTPSHYLGQHISVGPSINHSYSSPSLPPPPPHSQNSIPTDRVPHSHVPHPPYESYPGIYQFPHASNQAPPSLSHSNSHTAITNTTSSLVPAVTGPDVPPPPPYSSSVYSNLEFSQRMLTPEHFQQPVDMLNTLHSALPAPSAPSQTPMHMPSSASGADASVVGGAQPLLPGQPFVMGYGSPGGGEQDQAGVRRSDGGGQPGGESSREALGEQDFMSPGGTRLDMGQPKKRIPSTSGVSLNDQDLEYSSILWGDQTLVLLCPPKEEPYLAIPELITKVFHSRSLLNPQRRQKLGILTISATSLQIHALRARGSVDAFTGNTKLISLSAVVRVAADSNLPVPQNVIEQCKKYEYLAHPLSSFTLASGQPPHPQPSPSPISTASQPAITPHSSPSDEEEMSEQETLSAKVFPRSWDGVPFHPDVIDLGPSYRCPDGVVCQVRWGNHKLALFINSRKVYYLGLFQVYDRIFKEYVNRMNFKMRMRKLDIRSIRAPSDIRVKLIELNGLPPKSPVCGLLMVSEVEKLARSYGVVPPAVFYDVFSAKQSNQQKLPLKKGRPKKPNEAYPQPPVDFPPRTNPPFLPSWSDRERSEGGTEGMQVKQHAGFLSSKFRIPKILHHQQSDSSSHNSVLYCTKSSPYYWQQPSSSQPSHLHPGSDTAASSAAPLLAKALGARDSPSTAVTSTDERSDNSLWISIPRHLTRFRLSPEQQAALAHEQLRVSLQSNTYSFPSSAVLSSRTLVSAPIHVPGIQNLAKKISQKNKKLGTTRYCPSCKKLILRSKKRCPYCNMVLIGRPCPRCGVLNVNRAKECLKCASPIPMSWGSKDGDSTATQDSLLSRGSQLASSSSSPSPQRGEGEEEEGDSSLSPKFSAPPIRSAAIKSMFPQASDSQVTTKTIYSGNLASSRKCNECGQLNSKMAKKCVQCRSPLQGRPCQRCNRPNHFHSTECFKCGAALPPAANKWVYYGSHSGRAYKSGSNHGQDINNSSKEFSSRAPISCIRCHRLRLNSRLKCGRCGDVFETKALFNREGEREEEKGSPLKRRKSPPQQTNGNGKEDQLSLLRFARNILALDIGEGLSPLATEAEAQCRELIYPAEEDMEATEEQYQEFLEKKEDTINTLQDMQAEMNGLMTEVDGYSRKLKELMEMEEKATRIIETFPQLISELQCKIQSAEKLLASPT